MKTNAARHFVSWLVVHFGWIYGAWISWRWFGYFFELGDRDNLVVFVLITIGSLSIVPACVIALFSRTRASQILFVSSACLFVGSASAVGPDLLNGVFDLLDIARFAAVISLFLVMPLALGIFFQLSERNNWPRLLEGPRAAEVAAREQATIDPTAH